MTASGCWLPASAIETVCRDVIADIDNKRRRYVDDAIAPLLEVKQTWLQRFMGVEARAAYTRDEAIAELRGRDYGLGLICERAHWTQHSVATKLLALARAALECRDGAEMFVTAEDFDYIAYKWSAK